MGEPCHQQKLPDDIKKPLRITLTLFSKWGEIGSLDPLWQALLSPRMFKIATIARTHSNLNGFTIRSDKADLWISFPYQLNTARTFAAGCIIGAVSSMVIFNLAAISFSWIPVIVILGGFAGLLVRHHTSTELTVRGDLPDVIVGSDVLASWLSAGRGRKVRLEGGEKVYLETEAQKPEDIQMIFKAAISLQDQES